MDSKTKKTGIFRAAADAKSKTKKTGHIRRFIFRLLGPSASRAVVRQLLNRRIDKTPAAFPADLNRCSDILFILPEDRVEMIYQLETLFSIIGKYKDSAFTFVCPAAHSSFVSGLKNTRVISYDPEKWKLYDAEHNKVVKELSLKAFDICVMMERQYSLMHLYLVGVSRAHLRIGWDDGDVAPFLNIRIVESQTHNDGINLWNRNLGIAKIMNAEADTRVRYAIQKSAMDEISKLLNEYKLKKDMPLIGVDRASLASVCGTEWVNELMNALKKESISGQIFVFGDIDNNKSNKPADANTEKGGDVKDKNKDVPFVVLPQLTVAKTAALIAGSSLVITGPGAILGLAQISSTKIVPVLTKEQAATYCKQCDNITPVIIPPTTQPRAQTAYPGIDIVKNVTKNVKALL